MNAEGCCEVDEMLTLPPYLALAFHVNIIDRFDLNLIRKQKAPATTWQPGLSRLSLRMLLDAALDDVGRTLHAGTVRQFWRSQVRSSHVANSGRSREAGYRVGWCREGAACVAGGHSDNLVTVDPGGVVLACKPP